MPSVASRCDLSGSARSRRHSVARLESVVKWHNSDKTLSKSFLSLALCLRCSSEKVSLVLSHFVGSKAKGADIAGNNRVQVVVVLQLVGVVRGRVGVLGGICDGVLVSVLLSVV